MKIGMDIGSTAVKIVGMSKGKVIFTYEEESKGSDPLTLLCRALKKVQIDPSPVEMLAITGVGAEKTETTGLGIPAMYIPEAIATGRGGTWLAGISEAVVVSIGTGTCLVLARNGQYKHVGGTGVGSGTLRGLSKKLFGITNLPELFNMAEKGNRYNVDITIGDLFSGTDTLPLNLTASNLAKERDEASEEDWANGVINTVLEVAGSHAALACGGYGITNVIITGGISQTEIAKRVYDGFTWIYKMNYVIPPYSGFATAIGAALSVDGDN